MSTSSRSNTGGEIPLIGPKRRLVQWLASLLILLIPFVRVGGDSLLRLDAASRTLLLFGARIRIEEFYLFLLATLIFVFGFLLVTMLFGRVWCGWFCPQTTVCDLADWLDARVARLPKPVAAAVRHGGYLLLSFLIGSNLVWYFIPPGEYVRRLASGELGMVAGITLVSMLLLVYLDLTLVRRGFCKTVCPYGRIQLLTTEAGTLTLEFDPERKDECIRCAACLRACPMGIDIRDGLKIECINCGRCLDACRLVMAKGKRPGLFHYTFGGSGGSPSALLNRKSILLAGVLVLLTVVLALGVTHRREATVKVQRSASAEVKRLSDGTIVNFYQVFLENRSTQAAAFSLEAAPVNGYRVELVGPVRELSLAPNENRKVDVAVKVAPAPPANMALEIRLMRDGKVIATSPLPLLVN